VITTQDLSAAQQFVLGVGLAAYVIWMWSWIRSAQRRNRKD
jgi:hypothetical protein